MHASQQTKYVIIERAKRFKQPRTPCLQSTLTHIGLICFKLLYTRKLRQPGPADKIENEKNRKLNMDNEKSPKLRL